jgi:hypothetical protein
MDSGGVSRRLVEEFEGAGEGKVGVRDSEGRGSDRLECGLDQDSGGAGGAGEAGVLGIGDEGDLSGTGFIKSGGRGDFGFGIAMESCAEVVGKVR